MSISRLARAGPEDCTFHALFISIETYNRYTLYTLVIWCAFCLLWMVKECALCAQSVKGPSINYVYIQNQPRMESEVDYQRQRRSQRLVVYLLYLRSFKLIYLQKIPCKFRASRSDTPSCLPRRLPTLYSQRPLSGRSARSPKLDH